MAKRKSEYRVKIEHDEYPDLSWLEQWNTPEKYSMCPAINDDGSLMSFEDYMQGPGNKNNHVTLCMLVEKACSECGSWSVVESLSGIDLMAHSDFWQTGTFTAEEAVNLKGYLGECAAEMLSEAGAMFPVLRKYLDSIKKRNAANG
jgi:hypothetical protein